MTNLLNCFWAAISIGVVEAPQTVIDQFAMEIDIKDVHSFRRVVPNLGVSSLTVDSKEGWAYPEFYFNDGGLKDFMQTINMYVNLSTSPTDPLLILVNDMVKKEITKERITNNNHFDFL